MFAAPLDTLSRHQLNWNTYQEVPCRQFTPVGVHGKHLLIVGGEKKIGEEKRAISDVYKFSKVDHCWEVIGHIPSARCAAAAVSKDDQIIVAGGWNDKGQCTNTVWIGSFGNEPQ